MSERATVLLVVPTYYASQAAGVAEMASTAARHGISLVAVANSAAAAAALATQSVATRSVGRNLGYGASANLVASEQDFDWIAVCNDDLTFASDDLEVLAECLAGLQPSLPWIIGFLDDKAVVRGAPRLWGVFSSVAMLWGLTRRLRGLSRRPVALWPPMLTFHEVAGGTMFPFMCCAISATAWSAVAGFDSRFKLYFEDADFLARAARTPGHRFAVMRLRMRHAHAESSSRAVRRVFPVIVQSAREYLKVHHSMGGLRARLLLTFAIAVRIMLEPAVGTALRERWLADLDAARVLWTDAEADLPGWDDHRAGWAPGRASERIRAGDG